MWKRMKKVVTRATGSKRRASADFFKEKIPLLQVDEDADGELFGWKVPFESCHLVDECEKARRALMIPIHVIVNDEPAPVEGITGFPAVDLNLSQHHVWLDINYTLREYDFDRSQSYPMIAKKIPPNQPDKFNPAVLPLRRHSFHQ